MQSIKLHVVSLHFPCFCNITIEYVRVCSCCIYFFSFFVPKSFLIIYICVTLTRDKIGWALIELPWRFSFVDGRLQYHQLRRTWLLIIHILSVAFWIIDCLSFVVWYHKYSINFVVQTKTKQNEPSKHLFTLSRKNLGLAR